MGWKKYIYGAIGSMVGDIKKDARGRREGHQAHQEEVSSNYFWVVLTFFLESLVLVLYASNQVSS
jgi:hypothetical protein